jgi:hypothetical protein
VTKSRGILTRIRWTPEDDALLRELYPDTPTVQVAARLGRTLGPVYQRANKLGLTKSAAFLASPASGRTNGRQGIGTRFVKGQTPPNKGKPFPTGRLPQCAANHFKKGERSGVAIKLYKTIGAERISKDGYLERKIHDGLPLQSRWRGVHRIEWEAINGPQPKGFALKCLDGIKLNTDPSNWTLVPRAILPRLNGGNGRGRKRLAFDDAPAELKPTVLTIAKLEHAARKRASA